MMASGYARAEASPLRNAHTARSGPTARARNPVPAIDPFVSVYLLTAPSDVCTAVSVSPPFAIQTRPSYASYAMLSADFAQSEYVENTVSFGEDALTRTIYAPPPGCVSTGPQSEKYMSPFGP